jgi:hypothetical protein
LQDSTACGCNHTGFRTEPQLELTNKPWLPISDQFGNPDPSPTDGRPRVDPRWCFEGMERGVLEDAWCG